MSEISITQERLRNLRTQSGKNQDEVAEECGISRIALARYEGGQRMPKINILAKLAECYGVTVDYLMGRDEPTTAQPVPADPRREKAHRLLDEMDEQALDGLIAMLDSLQKKQK